MPGKSAAFPPGWLATSSDEAGALLAELKREMAPAHRLQGLDLAVIARASFSDDVLLRRLDKPDAWYVVHLTYARDRATTPYIPTVDYEGSLEDFIEWDRSSNPNLID